MELTKTIYGNEITNKIEWNKNAIKKSYKKIKNIYDSGKMPNGITLADFNTILEIHNELVNRKNAETISENVAIFFRNCGFFVVSYGVGFKIKYYI